MLSKPNRVVRAEDFRATMRKGRRVSTEHAVIYFCARPSGKPARFGFVVTKGIGGAVKRNQLRRRLRAIGYEQVEQGLTATDVVVRALPGSERLSWATLHQEISSGIEKGAAR